MAEEHWENLIMIGKGNLKDFQKDYESIGAAKGQFCTASQLFEVSGAHVDAEFKSTYEYIIYYKRSPKFNAAVKIEDNPQIVGAVGETITQEECESMMPDKQNEMVI